MAQIETKWLVGDIGGDKIKFLNDQYVLWRNAADSADVNVMKLNASDRIEFASIPQVSSDPLVDNDLARKKYVDDQDALLIPLTQKGAVNGVASLDGSGLVPAAQLPSYVDDVLEYANLAAFPGTGETGKIYVALDTNKTYRWSGSVYVEISAGPATTDDLAEGSTNLYYTQARFDSAFTAKSTTDLSEGTNLYYTQARFDSAFTAKSTSDLSEGTNLYFTDARAKSAAVVNSSAGSETDQAMSVAASKAYADGKVDDTAYGVSWDAVTGVAPSKNAVYDEIEAVKSSIAAVTVDHEYEIKTLAAGDITNGYVDLGFEAIVDSLMVYPVGGPVQEPGVDYTLLYTGGVGSVTRVTFAGDLASLLVATDKLAIKYVKA